MNLSVVILNWNQAADTIACVHSVEAWELEEVSIWVVDNGSQANQADRVGRECPRAHLTRCGSNLGFAGGNNAGLRAALAAGCDWVLLLNNDARLARADVCALADTLGAHPNIGMIGPVLFGATPPHEMLSAGGRDISVHVNSHSYEPLAPGASRDVEYVPGTCIMMTASMLGVVGLLDETYFFSGEIADLCARARRAGYRCVVDGNAHAYHALERSADARQRLHLYYVLRNRFLYGRKHHQRRHFFYDVFWTLFAGYVAALAALHGDGSRARVAALACLDGWRERYGGENERVLAHG